MVALIDLDSILYKAVYKVVSIQQMKEAIQEHGKEAAKQWLLQEVYNKGINRVEKQILEIMNYLEDNFYQEVEHSELFITTCKNSFRKKLASTYKAKRKQNNYVWLLRSHYMMNDAKHSDTHEADDLIARRARELGEKNCIVVSPDKDLKQIGGFYWSYYKIPVKDFDGDYILDEYGNKEKTFKQKEVEFISKERANYLFWIQMLMGDSTDGIAGLHRVGIKKAEKILKESKCYWFTVAREYLKRDMKKDFYINYKLLKLD